eukprot:CAMPEP_0114525142 /NCGR_PEP_ID=MMETSP0109-20121206/22252_1 /TAXON_ID=29199 /ORGANISM="Chlorarachnion reptans, Strain CCCM449" /LENGTH=528 /DNA_ID=CAMNT_0001706675 /DNA_START=87 /DNA_END=1673 /DNA_ORIENTATION=+
MGTSRVLLALLVSHCVGALSGVSASTDSQEYLKVTFALKPADGEALEKALLNISDPHHARFRQYLSHDEVKALVKPLDGANEAVSKWVKENLGEPSSSVSSSKHEDFLHVATTVQKAREAFALDKDDLATSKKSATTIVPEALKSFVYAIFDVVDTMMSPPSRRRRKLNVTGKFKGIDITPQILHKQYNIGPSDIGGKSDKNSQGVAAFEDAEFKQSDVDAFQKYYDLPSVKINVVGPNSGGYFGEAGLDTQYITACGRGVKSYFISHEEFNMLSWCEEVLNMTQIPTVLSISWGGGESQYPIEHQVSANKCFQKLGVLGVSVFAASGDDGTGKQGFFRCKKFDPTWPASSPWVTAVGATYIDSSYGENGWQYSGGGFSCNFDRPSYQDAAIETYLNTTRNLPDSSLYCKNGRATPDIAAVGTNYLLCSGGCGGGGSLSGTSASTPTVAGMVSVINDMLMKEGKAPVGFINPVLYENAHDIGVDILTGNNKQGCPSGFSAVQGWDAITGVGSPLFDKLKAVLVSGKFH